MKKVLSITLGALCLTLFASAGLAASAGEVQTPEITPRALEADMANGPLIRHSASSDARFSKALGDTFVLYGGPGTLEGKFQSVLGGAGGAADFGGWIGVDNTDLDPFWNISTFNAENFSPGGPGNLAYWSGVPAGTPGYATPPGYGNNWDDQLEFRTQVDNAVSHSVRLQLQYNHETEPGYDYFIVEYDSANVWTTLLQVSGSSADTNGIFVPLVFDQTISLNPGDLTGPGNDEVGLRVRVTSDGAWSDQDGLNSTTGGAAQVDNVKVSIDGAVVSDANFDGSPDDGDWSPVKAQFVGDFAKVFQRFDDIDPCRSNITPVIGFLDDGTPPSNAPGQSTGGTVSANWSYGIPGGWVTNYDGGLTFGSESFLNNDVVSPEILWDDPSTTADDGLDGGAFFRASVWQHLPRLNGIRWTWAVRSFPAGGTEWSQWENAPFVYFSSGSTWSNVQVDVSDRLVQNPERVQMALTGADFAEIFNYPGGDSTPAPVFDNAAFARYLAGGPAHTQRSLDPFMDSFANSGAVFVSDAPADLEALSMRVDMTLEISTGVQAIAGDSMIVNVVPVIPGTALAGPPEMKWVLDANPLFDPVRGAGLAAAGAVLDGTFTGRDGRAWNRYTGNVVGQQSTTSAGSPIADRYFFDLPDGPANPAAAYQSDEPALFFPGDIIRYYVETSDTGGNTTTLPANVDGWLDGSWGIGGRGYTIRGLPSLLDGDGNGVPDQPSILLINDFGRRGGENDYLSAFNQNGLQEGVDFDTYTANAPSSSITDGIGSAGLHGANAQQLFDYDTIMYTIGNLTNSLSDGVLGGDKGNDIEVMTQWHGQAANRYAVYFGDNFASALNFTGGVGQTYLNTICGVQVNDPDVRDEIDGQTAPLVAPSGGVPGAFSTNFVAFGGCLGINDFDSISPLSGAVRSHEFLNPQGMAGMYSASAGVWHQRTENVQGTDYTRVDLTFPFGFIYVWNNMQKAPAGSSARSVLIQEILEAFGKTVNDGGATGAGLPGPRTALFEAAPNPFNPSTRISFRIGERGHYSLKVFNLRGELVTTLIDGVLEPGDQSAVWNGKDRAGAAVSSGVYLYRLEGKDFVETEKMALVK